MMEVKVMRERVKALICNYVKEYQERENLSTKWGEPLVGFADAKHPLIAEYKHLIGENHGTPDEVLEDASIVIAYFVPFTKELAETNKTEDDLASREWAVAYEETNAMFKKLNAYIIEELEKQGYKAGISPKTATFSKTELKSNWSYRHFAYLAGLGTFGLNNMLITKHGCCGRYNNIVTNLDVEPDAPLTEELCLYKKNGSCKVCVNNCPVGALTTEKYDRHLCYTMLMKNAAVHTGLGSSYANEDGKGSNSKGTDVCGKCVTQSPCAFWNIE